MKSMNSFLTFQTFIWPFCGLSIGYDEKNLDSVFRLPDRTRRRSRFGEPPNHFPSESFERPEKVLSRQVRWGIFIMISWRNEALRLK
jgi:hypothetical protein